MLNLNVSNIALLDKWWWETLKNPTWCATKIIQHNYFKNSPLWNLHSRHHRRGSFFWLGIQSSLATFRRCIHITINNGMYTLFWLDNWLLGKAPKNLWPQEFFQSTHKMVIVHDLLDHFRSNITGSDPALTDMWQLNL